MSRRKREYPESKRLHFLGSMFDGSLVKGAPSPHPPLSNTPPGSPPPPIPRVRNEVAQT